MQKGGSEMAPDREDGFFSINPNNWGPYAHLPRPTTDAVEDLLKLDRSEDSWRLAVKDLIIHAAKLEIRVRELEALNHGR